MAGSPRPRTPSSRSGHATRDCLDLQVLLSWLASFGYFPLSSRAGCRIEPTLVKELQASLNDGWRRTGSECRNQSKRNGKNMMTAEVANQEGIEKKQEAANVPLDRIRVAPNTVAYVENHKLVVEFA